MEPTIKTVANKMVLPERMAQTLLQGKSRASDVAQPDQFSSVLRIGLAPAKGTGMIQPAESALIEVRH